MPDSAHVNKIYDFHLFPFFYFFSLLAINKNDLFSAPSHQLCFSLCFFFFFKEEDLNWYIFVFI